MTIASCYLSAEGVVLGADSTSTYEGNGYPHYYNFTQKLFEIGENSTLGIVAWGIGGLDVSHRTQVALLADDLKQSPPSNVEDVANRWIDRFWTAYSGPYLATKIKRCVDLSQKPAHDLNAQTPATNSRTLKEEQEYEVLKTGLVAGFCIGGYLLPDRNPKAYQIIFDPLTAKPSPSELGLNTRSFWGMPNIITRVITGCAEELRLGILASGKWNGTVAELDNFIQRSTLGHYALPIREAIDYTHACISSTIKAMKFSTMPQVCGGPIEIAVITTDRSFRWVRHKPWDSAIAEGEPS